MNSLSTNGVSIYMTVLFCVFNNYCTCRFYVFMTLVIESTHLILFVQEKIPANLLRREIAFAIRNIHGVR